MYVHHEEASFTPHVPSRRRRHHRVAFSGIHGSGRDALAQTAAASKTRFGAIYVPHGATMDKWTPAGRRNRTSSFRKFCSL